MQRLALLFLTVLVVACSGAPLSNGLPDTKVPIVSLPTGNMVIFYSTPFEFDRPPISARQIAVEGVAEYQQTPMSVHLYGSTALPQDGCITITGTQMLLCEAARYSRLTPAPLNFTSGATQPFRLEGDTLTQGVNQGRLWLGAQIAAESPSQGDILLRQMVIKIALF